MSEQQNRAEVLARKLKSHAIRWSDIDEAANLLRSQARALALLWEVVEILQYQPEQPNSPPSCPECGIYQMSYDSKPHYSDCPIGQKLEAARRLEKGE